MPTYEYACMDCGTHVEVYQSFTDEPLSTCGVCGGRLRKVFHPAGILFKGSGFYKTDSRTAAKKAPDAKPAGDGKVTSEKSSGPAESGTEKSGESKESGSGKKPSDSGSAKTEPKGKSA